MKNIKFGVFFVGLSLAVGGAVSLSAHPSTQERSASPTVLSLRAGDRQLGVRVSDTANGVRVDDVTEGSAAEKAGLKEGDLVVAFDGERVRSARQFVRLVQETPAGRPVRMAIRRDGKEQNLEATLESHSTFSWDSGTWHRDRFNFDFEDFPRRFDFRIPELGSRFPSARGRLGVSVQSMTPELAEYFGAKNGGVLVSSVAQDSPAAKAGVKAGDVITAINGDRITDSGDLIRELNDATSDDVTIAVLRDKKELTLKATVTRRSTGV